MDRIKNIKTKQILSIMVLISIFFSCLIFESGQLSTLSLKAIAPYLENKRIGVTDIKVASEISINSNPKSITIIDKKILDGNIPVEINIFILTKNIEAKIFDNFQTFFIPSNPSLVLKINKDIESLTLDNPKSLFPFKNKFYLNEKLLSSNGNQKLLLKSDSFNNILKIKVVEPYFFSVFYYIFPLILILILILAI
jgi:hypothetical protein